MGFCIFGRKRIERKPIQTPKIADPSKHVVHYSSYGRDNEFPAFTTNPQQDHHTDGITIRRTKDRRAQPWKELIRANIHNRAIDRLPCLHATTKQVREWIYLVLTQEGWSDDLPDRRTAHVGCTIDHWRLNGKALRSIDVVRWHELCPKTYGDIWGGRNRIPPEDRLEIGQHLRHVIVPLVEMELGRCGTRDAQLDQGNPEKKSLRKTQTSLDRKIDGRNFLQRLMRLASKEEPDEQPLTCNEKAVWDLL